MLDQKTLQELSTELKFKRPHIDSLDGLRGTAVLLVLVHHHGFLNMGWAGVDLFFVLSGYLITSILRSTRKKTAYWRPFWIKRATRILPPFLLMLVLAQVIGFRVSILHLAGYLFSFGDVIAYTRPDFEALRSLWSLAVEEHFYLLWPLAVLHLHKRVLILLLCALLFLEPLSRGLIGLYVHDWRFVYFLTPFRLDGLACGALLALMMEVNGTKLIIRSSALPLAVTSSAAWVVLRLLLGTNFTRSSPGWVYNSFCYTLVALVSLSVIAYLLVNPESFSSKVLSWRPLVWIGKVSYGLYLYQVPLKLLVVQHLGWSDQKAFLLDAPLVICLASLSFVYIEQPLILWGRRLSTETRS